MQKQTEKANGKSALLPYKNVEIIIWTKKYKHFAGLLL